MAIEYGVFTIGGCVEGGHWRVEDAEARADERRAEGDDDAKAAPFCSIHRDQGRQAGDECDLCVAELARHNEPDEDDR